MTASALPPLLSSDGHLEVRPERWTPRMPAHLARDKAPRTIELLRTAATPSSIEGQPPYPAPFLDLRAGSIERDRAGMPFGVTVDDTAGAPPEQRSCREQATDGLQACRCCFPTCRSGRGSGARSPTMTPTARRSAHTTTGSGEDVLPGLAGSPHRPWRHSVDEPRRCDRRAPALRQSSASRASISAVPERQVAIRTPDDDRFWAAAISTPAPACRPTVHVGFDRLVRAAQQPTFEFPRRRSRGVEEARAAEDRGLGGAAVPEHPRPSISLAQLAMSGVFDRLPDLNIFFAETRLGWVPFWMEEADYWYERHRHWAAAPARLQAARNSRPSEYVQAIHLLQRASTRARGSRAPPPHGCRAHHVRDRLPAHRVRLAQHAPLRRAAFRPASPRGRGFQDRGGQYAGVLPSARHAAGQEGSQSIRTPVFLITGSTSPNCCGSVSRNLPACRPPGRSPVR